MKLTILHYFLPERTRVKQGAWLSIGYESSSILGGDQEQIPEGIVSRFDTKTIKSDRCYFKILNLITFKLILANLEL